jgi:SAM-dependent MidA family methyltransferase
MRLAELASMNSPFRKVEGSSRLPSMSELGRHVSLGLLIRQRIVAEGGSVSFADFMKWALYEPGLGYYERSVEKIGRRGDFYTSVSVGPLFGQLLAFRFADWIDELELPRQQPIELLEVGAHDGTLAKDILGWFDQHRPDLLSKLRYIIVEPSEVRRTWQQKTVSNFARLVDWRKEMPETVHGLVFSNELLDAFPVHRLCWNAPRRSWEELGVRCNEWGFEWCVLPAEKAGNWNAPILPDPLLKMLPDRFTIEAAPSRVDWWTQAATSLKKGWLLTFDYGLETPEFFLPHRAHGTLRAFRQHRVSDDFLSQPGDADLTAHVDFTQVAMIGESCGLETVVSTWQSRWLVDVFGRLLNNPDKFGVLNPARVRQFQTLTHPEHLGRSFKVLVQRRH